MMRRARLSIVLMTVVAACAPVTAPAPSPSPSARVVVAADTARVPLAVHWTRTAAEHRAAFLQTYRLAAERLREAEARLPDGTWAVILDADETVIDNSAYQKRRAEAGLPYSSESWAEWVRERAAPALPGAVAFTRLVRDLGGRVAIVTNRDEAVCEPTRENLRGVGITFDVVLCRQPGEGGSNKNPRFQAVQQGTAGMPPATVLLWVGDNIQDFPALTQEIRARGDEAFDPFGRTYIVLPNPMYGSWERNPVQ
jgi:5'-nucleotidase (lipoprotein e(P4) family)